MQHRIQHSGEYSSPKWFIPNTLKYYVLLHDVGEGSEDRANVVYEDMKQRYGPQGCALLRTNTRPVSVDSGEQIPDPWGQYLHTNHPSTQVKLRLLSRQASSLSGRSASAHLYGACSSLDSSPLKPDTPAGLGSPQAATGDPRGPEARAPGGPRSHGACLTLKDHEHIRQFIQEFTFRGLLPHIEKNIRQLNDQVAGGPGGRGRLEAADVCVCVCVSGRQARSFYSASAAPSLQRQKRPRLRRERERERERERAGHRARPALRPSAALSTADLQEGPEPLALHRHQEVVWWRQSSGEGRPGAQEHLWPPVPARGPRAADPEDGRPVLPGAALRASLQLLSHGQEGLPVGPGHAVRRRSAGDGSGGSLPAAWSSPPVSSSLHGHGHPDLQGHLQVRAALLLLCSSSAPPLLLLSFPVRLQALCVGRRPDGRSPLFAGRNMVLAERCALLSAEILKSQGKYSETATLLIKMTSEDSDLRSALLLEQAAHCFIHMRNPMVRKFAFHMILAGHRYSKAGQVSPAVLLPEASTLSVGADCASRCAAALSGPAEEACAALLLPGHAGVQSQGLVPGRGPHQLHHWSAVLHAGPTRERSAGLPPHSDQREPADRHPAGSLSQRVPLRFQGNHATKLEGGNVNVCLPQLPLPCISSSATRVYFGHQRCLAEGEKQAATHVSLDQEYDADLAAMWQRLEEQLVAADQPGRASQPAQYCLNSQTQNLRQPLAVVEEPIIVEVTFRNPLKVPLALANLSLLWSFSQHAGDSLLRLGKLTRDFTLSHLLPLQKNDEVITTEVTEEFRMGPDETKMARLKLLPHRPGSLEVVGVVYHLAAEPNPDASDVPAAWPPSDDRDLLDLSTLSPHAASHEGDVEVTVVRGKQDLRIQGPRLNHTKEDKMTVRRGLDQRLSPIITPPMPLLEVFFLRFPTALLCGEVRKAFVEFHNVSAVALAGLRVASTHPGFFTFGSRARSRPDPPWPSADGSSPAYQSLSTPGPSETLVPADAFSQPSGVLDIPLEGCRLGPGESAQLPLWLRGPDQEGVHEIHFLFYYENVDTVNRRSRHRVLRHTVFICSSRSLSVRASACVSSAGQPQAAGARSAAGMLVFVDVENLSAADSTMRQFHIVQVSSSSPHWSLWRCINPAKEEDCKLGVQERAKLCFQARRCQHQPAALEKFVFADLSLGKERIMSSSTPCGEFFFWSYHTLRSQQRVGVASPGRNQACAAAAAAAEESTPDIATILKQSNELDLNIIIIWKAHVVEDNRQLLLEGQLHVALQAVGQRGGFAQVQRGGSGDAAAEVQVGAVASSGSLHRAGPAHYHQPAPPREPHTQLRPGQPVCGPGHPHAVQLHHGQDGRHHPPPAQEQQPGASGGGQLLHLGGPELLPAAAGARAGVASEPASLLPPGRGLQPEHAQSVGPALRAGLPEPQQPARGHPGAHRHQRPPRRQRRPRRLSQGAVDALPGAPPFYGRSSKNAPA
ncbi:unnamed protein product [Tetraodon nigroviridis]|uniref:(spotted green pufferfish) hypothetical protein n=1 Tax=Tetraodon nigroviridis TaxID=99883 RepID=Q4SRV8_TETNG|nr:unnamed protein product [Tetraodon nigroviridis]